MEETKIKGLKIIYSQNYMKIENTYQITNIEKIEQILQEAISKPTIYLTKRKIKSLQKEWIAHNFLYKIHICRKKNKDILFKKKNKKIISFIYFLLSLLQMTKYKIKKHFLRKKKKKKEKQYKKYIKEHLKNVKIAYQEEILNNPYIYLLVDKEILNKLYQRVLKHDESKFSKEEFDAYRKNYYPINDKEKEENKNNFDKAWEHHWKNNSHHWQYRQNKKTFNINDDDEILDVLENVLDWIAMGYKFKNRPTEYYEKNKNQIILCEKEKKFLEHILYDIIQKDGGQTWKKIIKKKNKKNKSR